MRGGTAYRLLSDVLLFLFSQNTFKGLGERRRGVGLARGTSELLGRRRFRPTGDLELAVRMNCERAQDDFLALSGLGYIPVDRHQVAVRRATHWASVLVGEEGMSAALALVAVAQEPFEFLNSTSSFLRVHVSSIHGLVP